MDSRGQVIGAFVIALAGMSCGDAKSGGGGGGTNGTGGRAGSDGGNAAGTGGNVSSEGTGGSMAGGIGGAASAASGGQGNIAGAEADGGRGGAAGASTSGGKGGVAGASSGLAGAGGAGGVGASSALPVDCPASPPSGACSTEFLVCAYPTQSCLCDKGAWNCLACPATRPATGSNFGDGTYYPYVWWACDYGGVTCTSPSGFNGNSYMGMGWACAACPANQPPTGGACGSSGSECRYGHDNCRCIFGAWSCATTACATKPVTAAPIPECSMQVGHYTCAYPQFDQNCVCGGFGGRRCSCPAAPPANGSACLGFAPTCKYGDMTCACGTNTWSCTAPPVCPASKPSAGAACSTRVDSCPYGNAYCSCDGTTWSCV